MNIYRIIPSLLVAGYYIILLGCSQETSLFAHPEEKLSTVAIDEFDIPVFPTPEEQFNYTRSWFKDFKEKRASLQGVLQLHPKARLQCGMAALDLAYSLLGNDYRLATDRQYHQAIAQFREILTSFSDINDIIAKSHWYIGWIYCDLLHDTKKGLKHYRIILTRFPDVEMHLASPVPWVSIVSPVDQEDNPPLYSKPSVPWANLAAVEIIRYTRDDATALNALMFLWKKSNYHTTTGIGLRLILERDSLKKETFPIAQKYIHNIASNPYLQRDIETALNQPVTIEADKPQRGVR